MSNDDRDQAGGHPRRRRTMYGCLCCVPLVPKHKSHSRSRREKAAWGYQLAASGDDLREDDIDQYAGGPIGPLHDFDGDRCEGCGVQYLDSLIYPPYSECPAAAIAQPEHHDTLSFYNTSTDRAPIYQQKQPVE